MPHKTLKNFYCISGALIADKNSLNELRNILLNFVTYAHLHIKKLAELEMGISEGMANIIEHSYKNRYKGSVLFEFSLVNKQFTAKLVDCGKPFKGRLPAGYKPNWKDFIEKERKKGFGLYAIHKTMDSIKYSRKNNCNILEIKKHI